jgi:hypothetical protein
MGATRVHPFPFHQYPKPTRIRINMPKSKKPTSVFGIGFFIKIDRVAILLC